MRYPCLPAELLQLPPEYWLGLEEEEKGNGDNLAFRPGIESLSSLRSVPILPPNPPQETPERKLHSPRLPGTRSPACFLPSERPWLETRGGAKMEAREAS